MEYVYGVVIVVVCALLIAESRSKVVGFDGVKISSIHYRDYRGDQDCEFCFLLLRELEANGAVLATGGYEIDYQQDPGSLRLRSVIRDPCKRIVSERIDIHGTHERVDLLTEKCLNRLHVLPEGLRFVEGRKL